MPLTLLWIKDTCDVDPVYESCINRCFGIFPLQIKNSAKYNSYRQDFLIKNFRILSFMRELDWLIFGLLIEEAIPKLFIKEPVQKYFVRFCNIHDKWIYLCEGKNRFEYHS